MRYLPEAGMSVQSQDANRAWQHSPRLARAIGVPISVRVEWRDKEEAAHPGELAEIQWAPTKAEVDERD